MTQVAQLVRHWAASIVDGWNRFWFTPTDPATLGLIRICAGAMLLYTHLVWSLDLVTFFGPHGWLSPDAVGTVQQDSYSWSYLWWFSSPAALWTVHLAALVVFAMLTVGWHSRVAAVLSFVAAAAYVGRATGALFGLDQINVMLAMYLAVSPCGAAYSVDHLLARRRAGGSLPAVQPSWGANVAIRLIQLHMCIIYLFAGAAKLTGPAWWDGTAMWMALGNMEYQSMDLTWMANWPRLINLLTHVTVAWELSYAALVWPRISRPIVLLLAIPLHLGIGLCLGMMTFGLVMLIGNLAFVPPALVRAVLPKAKSDPDDEHDSPAHASISPSKAAHNATRAGSAKR